MPVKTRKTAFTKSALLGALFATASQAAKYTIGVFSDIHLQPNYLPDRSPENYCEKTHPQDQQILPDLAYFGRMGCDVPQRMVEVAMQKMVSENEDLDLIMVPGDLIGHAISLDLKWDKDLSLMQREKRYNQLMSVHDTLSQLFETYFADVPFLPTFGNNDAKYHYQPAFGVNKDVFYDQIFNKWFTSHSANSKLENLDSVKSSLKQGGWYKVSLIPDELTLIAFNSLQFNSQDKETPDSERIAELDWFEEQLKNAGPRENFLITMHIYETASWWQGSFPNWTENEQQARFFSLMEEHREKIVLEVVGHDHLAGMRYSQVDGKDGDYYLNKVLFPGLTASSKTQPGFATFVYDSETRKAEQLKFTYIDLDSTIGLPETTPFDELTWFDVDFGEKFDLLDLSGASMADFVERMDADPALAREYEFNRMGVDTQNPGQMEYGLQAYIDLQILGQKREVTVDDAFTCKQDFVTTSCVMSEARTSAELALCDTLGQIQYGSTCVQEKPEQEKKMSDDNAWEKFLV